MSGVWRATLLHVRSADAGLHHPRLGGSSSILSLVAERIVRLAKIVGRERVMASRLRARFDPLPHERSEIEPEIVWGEINSFVKAGASGLANEVDGWGLSCT